MKEDYKALHNGKARILVPVDPALVAAYRLTSEGKRYVTRQFKSYQSDWTNKKENDMGKVKSMLPEDWEPENFENEGGDDGK